MVRAEEGAAVPVQDIVDRDHARAHDRLPHPQPGRRSCDSLQRKHQLNHPAGRSEAKPHWYCSRTFWVRRRQWKRRARAWCRLRHHDQPSTRPGSAGGGQTSRHSSRRISGTLNAASSTSRARGSAGSARSLAPCVRGGRLAGAHHHQERVRQHRQGDVAVPGVVAADLVVVQPGLALGLLKAALNRPTTMHS